ncbi:hypothetical protein SDJN03_18795, partial [Cucurbita argyrosperma subsp. sororia]
MIQHGKFKSVNTTRLVNCMSLWVGPRTPSFGLRMRLRGWDTLFGLGGVHVAGAIGCRSVAAGSKGLTHLES